MLITTNQALINQTNRYQLKIYDCGYADVDAAWHPTVTAPSFSRLYFILGGDAWFQTGEDRTDMTAGCCYLLPSPVSFQCGCKSAMQQFYFHIALFDENGQDMLPFIPSPLSMPFSSSEKELLTEGIQADKPSIVTSLGIHSLIFQTLFKLFEHHQLSLPEKHYSPCVSCALQHIHQNVSASLTLEEVTSFSFVSQTTLSKRFRQELGVTVGHYIENLVFSQAQNLLRDPSLSIADISERLGFCDQFYFSSRFKQRYRQSPLNYRKTTLI